jgi:hypothetical protein
MPFGASEEQALAVFTSSGEAVRFLIGQRWQVTNYALAAYVALVAAPEWISKNDHRSQITAGLLCAVLAFVTFGLTSYHLCNLQEEHADQLGRVYTAGMKLSLVAELHGWPTASPGEPGGVICAMVAALFVGALLVAWINVSRPMVVARFNTWWVMAVFAGVVIVIALLMVWRTSLPFWRACLVQPLLGS